MYMMNIQIKNTNFNMTPDIEEYLNSKILTVEKFLGNVEQEDHVLVEAEVERLTHRKKGEVFRVEFNVTSQGKLYRAEATSFDPRSAIDIAKDQIEKQIRRSKTKRFALFEKGARAIKRIIKRN